MNKLSIYDWHLYPKCKALIHPGKIVDTYTCEFMIAWSSEHAPKPILKPIDSLTPDECSSLAAVGKEQYSVIYSAHYMGDGSKAIAAYVQTRGNSPRKCHKTINLDTYTPEQFKFLLEKHYDVFGWIDKGLAVTQSQAENDVWRDVSKEVEQLPETMALYKNALISAAQTGMEIRQIGEGRIYTDDESCKFFDKMFNK